MMIDAVASSGCDDGGGSSNHHAEKSSSSSSSSSDESQVLMSLVGGDGRQVKESFFDTIWQHHCTIFRSADRANSSVAQQQHPLKDLIDNGWDVVVNLLEEARYPRCNNNNNNSEEEDRELETNQEFEDDPPLVFLEQESLSPETVLSHYDGSLFGAYLDGASIVINHADLLSAPIARLCQDLQKSLPHAYANTYLTPPLNQTVPCHADDRDVLIVQVYGSKQWKVYQTVPVPYPYPHEQVGKNGLAVPIPVLQGPLAIDTTLYPGDVLYMPRGFVHEAKTNATDPSFHVTVALATHDWTMAGALTAATSHCLSTTNMEFRKALPVEVGMKSYSELSSDHKSYVSQMLNEAFERLRQEVTVESICEHMTHKYQLHNQRANVRRMALMEQQHESHQQKQKQQQKSEQHTSSSTTTTVDSVGFEASQHVTLQTVLRAATPTEKAMVLHNAPQYPRGLNVRENIASAITNLLVQFKNDPHWTCTVMGLKQVLLQQQQQLSVNSPATTTTTSASGNELICDLTLLSFAKRCVELAALAIVVS